MHCIGCTFMLMETILKQEDEVEDQEDAATNTMADGDDMERSVQAVENFCC
jgi:hypothetical protein